MRKAIACLTLFASTAYAVNTDQPVLRGYTSEHSASEVQWEQKFRAIPDPARVRENMKRMAARPHHVGSPYDKDNAEWLVAQLKSYGWTRRSSSSRLSSPLRSRASWSCWGRRSLKQNSMSL